MPRRQARRAALLGAAAFVPLLPKASGLAAHHDWNYGNQTRWAQIPGTMCGHGSDQSPIDMRSTKLRNYPVEILRDGKSVHMGPAAWSYDWALVNASLGWSEHGAWEVRLLPPFAETTRMTFLERDFSLKTFHFTSPSENRIEGEGFDMEVQHVLESSDRRVLIISVMLRVGLVPDNPYLSQFWGDFPAYSAQRNAVDKIITNPFYGAFPKDRSFFVFKGSLTHPPCTNEVTWVVFQEPLLISRAQRDAFRAGLNSSSHGGFLRYAPGRIPPKGVIEPWDTSMGMNNRHLEPQGLRQVVKVSVMAQAPHAASNALPANSWAYVVLGLLAGALLLGVFVLAIVAKHHAKQRVTRGQVLMEDEALEGLPGSSPESGRRRVGKGQRRSRSLGSSGRSTRSSSSRPSFACTNSSTNRSAKRAASPVGEEDLRFSPKDGHSGAGSPVRGEVEMQLLQDKSAPLPAMPQSWTLGSPPDLRAALLPAEQLARTAARSAPQLPAPTPAPLALTPAAQAAAARPLALAPRPPGRLQPGGAPWLPPGALGRR